MLDAECWRATDDEDGQRAQLKIDIRSDELVWTPARQELWRRIEQHDFEPDTPLNFTRRLARDLGWSLEEARAAVDAYRRFCFLAIVSATPVTPSESSTRSGTSISSIHATIG